MESVPSVTGVEPWGISYSETCVERVWDGDTDEVLMVVTSMISVVMSST